MINEHAEYYSNLVKRLCKLPAETEWLELKCNNENPQEIGEYISALSNSAALNERDKAYLIWGVDDVYHNIIGTKFCPAMAKVGNQELENWLLGLLNPNLYIKFINLSIDDKNVVILEIPRAVNIPVSFKGLEYIRIGSYKKKLKDFSEKERALWQSFSTTPYELMPAAENVTEEEVTVLLDCAKYYELMNLPLPTNRAGIIYNMLDEEFIRKNDVGNYTITNLGALLFAKNLNNFRHLKRKAIRVVQYNGTGRTQADREKIFEQGYAVCFSDICGYINTLIPQSEEINADYRKTHIMFPQKAIREMVSNLIIHQQLDVRGAGPMVEIFSTRVETSNPGNLLVDVNRIIDTAPHSRNEAMASFLRIIRVCEERGSGFDRMEEGLGELKIPAPKVETGDNFTRTKLYWYPELSAWDKEDKIRTCYLSTCYNYVNDIAVSNAVLRNRFGVEDKNKAIVSRIIKDTMEAGLIKLSDEKAAPKMRRYIPYWA